MWGWVACVLKLGLRTGLLVLNTGYDFAPSLAFIQCIEAVCEAV